MRVLLTGATGFVGANLARRLVCAGHEVFLILRPGYKPWRITDIRADVALHTVDLSDEASTLAAVRRIQADWIFHLAVHGAYSSQTDTHQMVATNIMSTINLINSAAEVGFRAFINTGSSSEYGLKDHPPDEQEWIDPNSEYAVTKAAATHYCRYLARARSLTATTLRLYSVYGPWEEPTRLVPTILIRAREGTLPPLVAPGTARDYVYVDDVIDAYLAAATQGKRGEGAVYNVGTGVQTSLWEMVETVRSLIPVEEEPRWGSMAQRSWDTSTWVADTGLIQGQLGWTPRYSVRAGLMAMVSWLDAHPDIEKYYRDRLTVASA